MLTGMEIWTWVIVAALIGLFFVACKLFGRTKQEIEETPKQENWFSWGWLIFWIILCFPIAIIYLLVKMGNKKK
jgi:hypothetical protein